MCVFGSVESEGRLQEDLAWGAVEKVGSAHHVGDARVRIVHHDGELVGVQAVSASNDEITDFAGDIDSDASLDRVYERNC